MDLEVLALKFLWFWTYVGEFRGAKVSGDFQFSYPLGLRSASGPFY